MLSQNPCHGCLGKGWVSPSYGVAVKCPVCNGAGILEQTAKQTFPPLPTQPPIIPHVSKGKCQNARPDGTGVCYCTGACMGYRQSGGKLFWTRLSDHSEPIGNR